MTVDTGTHRGMTMYAQAPQRDDRVYLGTHGGLTDCMDLSTHREMAVWTQALTEGWLCP